MQIIINEEDVDKAKRLLETDNAFGLLWDLDQHCRNIIKYESTCGSRKGDKARNKALEEIRDIINDSHLLDLYN